MKYADIKIIAPKQVAPEITQVRPMTDFVVVTNFLRGPDSPYFAFGQDAWRIMIDHGHAR